MATAEETLSPRLSSGEESRALAKEWRGPHARRDDRRDPDQPGDLPLAARARRHGHRLGDRVDVHHRRSPSAGSSICSSDASFPGPRCSASRKRPLPRGRRRQPAPRLVLALLVAPRLLHRPSSSRCFWVVRLLHGPFGDLVGHSVTVLWDFLSQPQRPVPPVRGHPPALLPDQLPILFGPLALMGITQMQSFEPGDAEWGVKLERRARPGGGEEGRPPGGEPLAVGRGIRAGGRKARARALVPRRARNREDDAVKGDRDRLQLPVPVACPAPASPRPSSAWT